MAKVSIEGIYYLTGNHLTRQDDGQLIEVQPNPSKPKITTKRHPKELLILIQPNGQRVRLSGLFDVNTTGQNREWSCDIEGVNYHLCLYPDQTAEFIEKSKKEKVGRVLTFSGKKLAACSVTTTTNQLNLW